MSFNIRECSYCFIWNKLTIFFSVLPKGTIWEPSVYNLAQNILLSSEILATQLCKNSLIRGIKVNQVEYLISQFPDDMDLYLSLILGTHLEICIE